MRLPERTLCCPLSDVNRVVIVADDYQFLDTVHGPTAAIVQEWQIANTLERLAELVMVAPLAVVIDLEAPGIDAVAALHLLKSTRSTHLVVLLTGTDRRKLRTAQRLCATAGLEVAGALERPSTLNALSRLVARHASASAPIDVDELKRALIGDELLLHYQPIYTRSDEHWTLCGAEALVRWQHPKRGLLYPGQFLSVAEAGALVGDMTDLVIAAAVQQVRIWHHGGLDLRMSINLPPGLAYDRGFLDRFLEILRRHRVSPERITLEVTEVALAQDLDLMRDILTHLRTHGVSLALDDFGTGHSSLIELSRLPFNEIKIDRTLIRDVPDVPAVSTIIAESINLAHRLRMRACAEGVETHEALEFLREQACDSAQGVLFAPPMSAMDLERVARSRLDEIAMAASE